MQLILISAKAEEVVMLSQLNMKKWEEIVGMLAGAAKRCLE